MLCWPCCVMFAGTALSVRVFVYAGLSLFIINGPYLYVVVCVLYAYNLTDIQLNPPISNTFGVVGAYNRINLHENGDSL